VRRAALALAIVAACSHDAPVAPGAPPRIDDAGAAASPIAGAAQLVVGVTPDWDSTTVTLARFARAGQGWTMIGAPWAAVIGRSGAAWGRGLHGEGAPAGAAGPVKREGDGRAPAGAFAIADSYGYATAALSGSRTAYHPLDAGWRCVDDPASTHYNRVFDAAGLAIDWTSAEDMRRADALYTWVIEIAHNRAAAAGGGSCIFFHVWSGAGSSTAGCTAMPQDQIEGLLGWLDPAQRPAYVLLPRAEYTARMAAWGLPALP
jgi:D-alanyl-D-alanine dipeptidase